MKYEKLKEFINCGDWANACQELAKFSYGEWDDELAVLAAEVNRD